MMCRERGSKVDVKINVTEIVKYVCITGVAIVGIIFSSKCVRSFLKKKQKEFGKKRKVAIKREKSNACISYSERQQLRRSQQRKSLKKNSSILLKRGIFRSCLNIDYIIEVV